ncbi:MAG TPA: hypothetical protein VF536_23930 [Roseateles sp.]
MKVVCLFDPAKGEGPLTVTLVAQKPLPKVIEPLIGQLFEHLAVLVSTQGLSPGRDDAKLSVQGVSFSADGQTAIVALQLDAVPAVAWRVLLGLLSAFSKLSAALLEFRLEQPGYKGAARSEKDLIAAPYPETDTSADFDLSHEESASDDANVEVTFTKGVPKAVRGEIEAAMNAWLETATGGFFKDSDPPGYNAHDCPEVTRAGARVLIASFDTWEGDEGAFRAVINQMAHFQRLHGCIESVSVE